MDINLSNSSNISNISNIELKTDEIPYTPHSKKHLSNLQNIVKLDNGNFIDKSNASNICSKDNIIICKDIIKEYSVLKSLLLLIHEKKVKLIQSKSILELKYNKYKKCHNFWNICTIILSSTLTFIESCKLVFIGDLTEIEEENLGLLHKFFELSPIIIGTFITCSASIIKFKKYQEQMEEIYIVIDKCIGMISRLKNKRDEIIILRHKEKQLNICDDDDTETAQFQKDVQSLNNTFKNDIIKDFSNVYVETEKYINYNDYSKYLHKINETEYRKHILRLDEKKFFEKYIHDIEDNRMNNIKKETLNKQNHKNTNCCGF